MSHKFVIKFKPTGEYCDRYGRAQPDLNKARVFNRSCDAKNSNQWQYAKKKDDYAVVRVELREVSE